MEFSIGSNGLGAVFVLSAENKPKYDNMPGTQAQILKMQVGKSDCSLRKIPL